MNIFNKIPLLRPKRNVFNLGFENRLSTDLFRLTPVMCKEVLPDDVFTIQPEVFTRVLPSLNAPVMQRFNLRTYNFFVPTRIIWDEFEKWINPKSGETDIVAPRVAIDPSVFDTNYIGMVGPKSLADYLGLNFGLAPEDQTDNVAFKEGIDKIFTDENDEKHAIVFSALPFRAYQQIYNDWFIDLNNIDIADFSKGSGVEVITRDGFIPDGTAYPHPLYHKLLEIRNRAWEHDYFTSAMPDPQRGPDVMAFDGTGSEIEVSITGKAGQTLGSYNIRTLDNYPHIHSVSFNNKTYYSVDELVQNYADFGFANADSFINANSIVQVDGHYRFGPSNVSGATNQVGHLGVEDVGEGGPQGMYVYINTYQNSTFKPAKMMATIGEAGTIVSSDNKFFTIPSADVASVLEASVSGNDSASGVTVEELRIRMQMQSFLERNEIGGSRYTEMLYAHWGVKDPDGRLQRSEFIGGSVQPLRINEVTQTSAPTDEDPLGQYAGQGMSSGVGKKIRFRAPEHGFIITLMAIMPRTGYFQGIEPMWTRFDRLQMYWPSFAHLGEQEVKNKEIMFTCHDPEGTFGYQQRYAEYKCSMDQVHGDMKGSLAFWHGARAFQTPEYDVQIPKLSGNFTTPSGPGQDGIDRIFPVLAQSVPIFNADHFVVDCYMHVFASRRMPKFVTPRNGS